MTKKSKTDTGQKSKNKSSKDLLKTNPVSTSALRIQAKTSSSDETNSVLHKRARVLAIEKKQSELNQETLEIIVFNLASESYAIETNFVREVYPLKSYTRLPGLPAFILGIINVRGQIISVVDLKKFFALPEKGITELNKVIIVHDDQMEFGILVDKIEGTRSLPVHSLSSSLTNITEIGDEYLKGVTSDHLIILDMQKMLKDENMIIDQSI